MICKDNMANFDYKSLICNTKHKNLFGLKKIYDQKKKKKTHIMLNKQCKAMHDSA